MKRHLVFLTFIFSVVNVVTAYMSGDNLALIGWLTASIASIDHFFTLKKIDKL